MPNPRPPMSLANILLPRSIRANDAGKAGRNLIANANAQNY